MYTWIHASESRAGTHEQIPNIMEVDRIHIQIVSLHLIHIMCGDVSNIPNEKFTSTTLWMLDTLNSYIQCQKDSPNLMPANTFGNTICNFSVMHVQLIINSTH